MQYTKQDIYSDWMFEVSNEKKTTKESEPQFTLTVWFIGPCEHTTKSPVGWSCLHKNTLCTGHTTGIPVV